jgi:hypothetical protein
MILTMEHCEALSGQVEVEIQPGWSVYILHNGQAVFCPWDRLSDDQREGFQVAHAEFVQAAAKVRGLFKGLPQPEPGEDW